MNLPLLGSSHRDSVDALHAAIARLQAGDSEAPRVVLLRGAQGDGKTRIVQELYSTLAAAQPQPAYWPPLPAAAANPLLDRKDLRPPADDFVWPADSLPTFGWWAFTCRRDEAGRPSDSVAEADPDLRAHLLPLALAHGAAIGLTGRARENFPALIQQARAALIEEGGMRALEAMIKTLNFAVPLLGQIVAIIGGLSKSGTRMFRNARALAADTDLGVVSLDERAKRSKSLAQSIGAVAHATLPGILVIEDATDMSDALRQTVDLVVGLPSTRPVLTIMTAWPESEHEEPFRSFIADLTERGKLLVIDVDPLREDDLKQLIRSIAPESTDAEQVRLAQAFPSPLMLKLYLGLPFVEARIQQGGPLGVTDDDLIHTPKTIGGLYRARWEALPDDVKKALVLAAGASVDGPAREFLSEIVAEAAVASGAAGVLRMADVSMSLQKAIDPYGWCETGSDVVRFTGRQLETIASEAVLDALGREYTILLQAEVGHALVRWLEGDVVFGLDQPQVVAASRWLTELEPNGSGATHLMASLLYAQETLYRKQDYAKYRALARLDDFRQILAPGDPLLARVETESAVAEMQLGNFVSARDLVKNTVDNREVLFAQISTIVLMAITVHCVAQGKLGDPKGAASSLQMLLDDVERITGDTSVGMGISIRHELAQVLWELEEYALALEQWEEILRFRESSLGPVDVWTLEARAFVCLAPNYMGDPARSIELLGPLVGDLIEHLGIEEQLTTDVLGTFANLLWSENQMDQAIEPYYLLLSQISATSEPTEPDLVDMRNSLEACINESETLSSTERMEWYRKLADLDALLTGPNGENAVRMRGWAALSQFETGDVEGFLLVCEDLLPLLTETLGDDDFMTHLVLESIRSLL